MTEARICPRCGNTIQDWAGGVCYVCARYENVYHKPLPKKRYGYAPPKAKPRPASIQPLSQQCRPKPVKKPLPKKRYGHQPPETKPRPVPIHPLSQQCRPKLESFNGLLAEIYGQETHFSEILDRHDVKAAHPEQWRRNKDLVKQFLDALEARLLKMLKEQFPHENPAIWARHHIYNWSPQAIAKEFRVSAENVKKCCLQMIGFLRSTHGIALLEQIICEVASKVSQ